MALNAPYRKDFEERQETALPVAKIFTAMTATPPPSRSPGSVITLPSI